MEKLREIRENREIRFTGALLAGAIGLSWMAAPGAHTEPSGEVSNAYRTTSQILGDAELRRRVKKECNLLTDGATTYVFDSPGESLQGHSLCFTETRDTDGVNLLLDAWCDRDLPRRGSAAERDFYQGIGTLISLRAQEFTQTKLAQYLLIRTPAASGSYYPIYMGEGGTTRTCATRNGAASYGSAIIIEPAQTMDEVPLITWRTAHEIAHNLQTHILADFYVVQDQKQQEFDADRIAFMLLRDEKYIKAAIAHWEQKIVDPTVYDQQTGEELYCEVTQGADTHPSHEERIKQACNIWVELLMARDGVSYKEALNAVNQAYRELQSAL